MKRFIKYLYPMADLLLVPLAFPSAWILWIMRRTGVNKLPGCKNVLMKVGNFRFATITTSRSSIIRTESNHYHKIEFFPE